MGNEAADEVRPDLERLLRKIRARIREDFAFVYAEFGEKPIGADKASQEALIRELLVKRLDVFAHWHLFAVPHLLAVEAFVDCVQDFADGDLIAGKTARKPPGWKLASMARVVHWRGMALARERTLGSKAPPQELEVLNRPEQGRVLRFPRFPARAVWLEERLRERSWNKYDLARHGGPDRDCNKTGSRRGSHVSADGTHFRGSPRTGGDHA